MTEFMGLAEKVSKFNQQALKHIENQALNPFSGRFSRSPSPRPKFNKDEYGKPAAGSLTEMRGQRAFSQISREILELCEVIHDMGARRKDDDGDECIIIPFGELFAFYTKISDKVVGLLIAAKKRGFVFFEPEILFQRRDDDVLIALLMPIGEIRNVINRQISASPSPAPTSAPESEKTSPCPTPSPLAKQNNSTLSEAPSTPAQSEIRTSPPTPAKSSEEQQAASSSKEENVSQDTPSPTVIAAESLQTIPSPEPLLPIEEEPKSSSEVPVVESVQAPISEVPTEAEKTEVVEINVAEPPVEDQTNSSSIELAIPSEGVETSPSSERSEEEQISQSPESTFSTEEEKTCTESPMVPEEQTLLKPTEEEASLKITVYQIINDSDQPLTASTSTGTDLVSSSGEAEQTTLPPETRATADESPSSITQIAPDENEQTSTSPVTSVEPEQSLPPSDKSEEVIPSNEKEETPLSNDTEEKTLS